MRLPTHISQETLKKTHDKMSGNWHGSIHQQEGFEYERRSKHRNTLGSFLVDNHGFINAAKFDELAPERDIIPIPSISSTKDMEQAISRFSHSQSFREDEDRLDSEGILRTLTALRNGRGVDSGREAYKNEEEREPPPPVFNEDAYDDATNNAFETLDPRGIRYPIKSLADESLASPSNCDRTGRLPHHYPVYNREKSVTKPQDTMAYSIATRISTTVQTIKKQSVFQNIPSLLQKSCVPLNSALNNDGEKGKPSIWSYLDPNDDLVYYDDHNDSYSSSDRGVRKNRRRKSTKKDSSLKRGATDTQQPASNALQEAYEDLMFINREAEGQQKSNQTSCSRNLSEQQQGRATRKGNYSHSNFSEIPTKISSGYRTNTPTTISTYSQSTVSRTTPDLSTEGSVSNDNLWKRNPMGETLLSSTAQIKESSPDPQKRSNELQRFEKQHFRVRAHAPIRVTVTSNDNTKSEARTENSTETTRDHERTVSNSHTHFGGQETYNTGGITYTQNPFPFGDEDVYRGWKEVAQTAVTPKSRNSSRGRAHGENVDRDIVHGSFHAELVARAQTRYRSNDSGKTHQRTQQNPKKDGFETTAAFSSRNKEEESRRISTTPKRGASLDRRQMMVSNHRRGSSDKPTKPVFLPFTPDFYMLEALGREITGVPLGVSKQQQASFTITSPNKEESCVSNLSSVDGSGNGAQEEKRLENKLNKVFGRSMKNVQQLQHFKEETCQTGIPEHLPGASDPFTSEDLHSANAVEFANCLHTMERNMERGVCKLGFNTEKPKLIAGHDGTSATSESSNSTPHVASHKALGKSYREDVNGHYMYVAYSRFGEDAREVIQLCEHQSPPTPNTRNGEVLVKILVSFILLQQSNILMKKKPYPSNVLLCSRPSKVFNYFCNRL